MTWALHRGAEQDLDDAFRFYLSEAGRAVAARFLDEFERVLAMLEARPELGTPTGGDRRRFPLRGFPYSVIYRQAGGALQVLVVRHQSRDPGHGTRRR